MDRTLATSRRLLHDAPDSTPVVISQAAAANAATRHVSTLDGGVTAAWSHDPTPGRQLRPATMAAADIRDLRAAEMESLPTTT